MYCINCGSKLPDEGDFCYHCGTKKHYNSKNTVNDIRSSVTSETNKQTTSQQSSPIIFSTGSYAWLLLCALGNGLLALVYFIFLSGINVPGYGLIIDRGYAIYLFVGSIVMCVCFSLIIKNKIRLPYYITILHTLIVFICNISMNSNVNVIMVLIGLSNPVITYLVIKKYWSGMPLI